MMKTFQPLAIGLYEAMGGKINNRLVYKHVKSKFNFPVLNFLVAKSFTLLFYQIEPKIQQSAVFLD